MKPIKFTEQEIEQLKQEFADAVEKARMADGKITISKNFGSREAAPEERISIYYTPEAYLKMDFLVRKFDSEVGWHGLVRRINDRCYLVYDVLVYDQEVTGSTVNTDQDGYVQFLVDLPEEKANFMHFHGHSHVNMAVTPSPTDMTHRDNLLQTADEDGFWIFQIWNKRGDISSAVYDLAKNTLYEDKDINLQILFEDGTLSGAFMAVAQSHVKPRSYAPKKYVPPKTETKKDKKKESEETLDADDLTLIDDGTKPYGKGYNYNYSYDHGGGWDY